MHNHNGVLVGTYDNLNAAWLSVKSEEGPLSKEPQTLKEFNDALAYADCYAKEV
jgi:hypothetical protein